MDEVKPKEYKSFLLGNRNEESDQEAEDKEPDMFASDKQFKLLEDAYNIVSQPEEKPPLDPMALLDSDLMDLLLFCHQLKNNYKLNNEDYENQIFSKSFELGKKTKQRLLVFDMDETLISAKFAQRAPPGFITNYSFDFHGKEILVRTRPHL